MASGLTPTEEPRGRLVLPTGCVAALNVGIDFDAQSVWLGAFGLTSPGYMSRGEFGAEDGVPRLLKLLDRLSLRSTWFVPGHTLMTFPRQCNRILGAGHEIAAHGCYHETLGQLEAGVERHLMERQLEQHLEIVGLRPRGYRSPAWDFTTETMGLLEEFGFDWDSSLMGREFLPYHPRPVTVSLESGNSFGTPSSLLEIPVSWHTVDWETTEFVPGVSAGLGSADLLLRRWLRILTYAREREPGGVVTVTLHPQAIGRAYYMLMLEDFLQHSVGVGDVWIATSSEICDAWTDQS